MMNQQAEAILVQPVSALRPPNPYLSEVPRGFDTVLGYLSQNNPEALDLLGDPIWDTRADELWLRHQANRRAIGVVKVEASEAAREYGFEEVNAYPLHLLTERLGA